MDNILIFFLIGLFVAMLFVNIYFRWKVLKAYRHLVNNRIEFGTFDVFKKDKIEQEIIPQYPSHAKQIRDFARHIRYSVRMATILLVLITIFGAVLMYFR